MVGVFPNAPTPAVNPTGCKSSRAAIWLGVDPSRCGFLPGLDGPREYLDFALDANLLVLRSKTEYRPGRPGFTFRRWMREERD